MKNYANSIAYGKYLEQYNYIFEKTYFIKQAIHSLTEDIKLIIDNYNHSYDITHNYGKSISCQNITLQDKTGNEIFTARYAFGKLFHQYIKHSNNNEYFIAGNDLMEFSIYNITKSEEYKFVSECRIDEESDEGCDNEFWYIKEWIYNPTNNLIAINGQDLMNCATITVGDFTNPEMLPLKFKNLHKVLADQYGDGPCNAIRWTDRNCLELEVCEENTRTVSLTEQEIVSILRTK
ncbi:hypothetical protein [Sphingobacterium sp. BIGb0165]|uniref:hypothetical protein n=1 Tax=Sphingobacterium sp. BIGb0165 TaxID=2940615 RepID=UPI0021675B4B|nr:hypothetical protein [Sphingobacterium sp. BIGb0165]MCS4224610.1 hypothetical protein [Sphingobacterium sp. BIGb0165]